MLASNPRKALVILAHTPPPFHGQALMVSLMLEALKDPSHRAADPPIFHVNCRYSDNLESMGRFKLHKFFSAIRYAIQTLAIRFRYGASSLYYVPAPGKHPAFLRDCLVLSLIRPFFTDVILQWHAAGLSCWLETQAWGIERWMARRIYCHHSLSIVQLDDKVPEAAYFLPKEIQVIPYGIPDPCPDFKPRLSRTNCSSALPIHLLFLSMATREKGVFAAVEVWKRLNQRAARNGGPGYRLTIAGEFPSLEEEQEFHRFLEEARSSVRGFSNLEPNGCDVEVIGSVHGEQKSHTYSRADIFLFPSTYPWESFGVVLLEAAHFGLPCVTYQPLISSDGLSPEYHRRVPVGDIEAFTSAIELISLEHSSEIRADAKARYNFDLYAERMRAACLGPRNSQPA